MHRVRFDDSPSSSRPSSAANPLSKTDFTNIPIEPRGLSVPPTILNPRPFPPDFFSRIMVVVEELKGLASLDFIEARGWVWNTSDCEFVSWIVSLTLVVPLTIHQIVSHNWWKSITRPCICQIQVFHLNICEKKNRISTAHPQQTYVTIISCTSLSTQFIPFNGVD